MKAREICEAGKEALRSGEAALLALAWAAANWRHPCFALTVRPCRMVAIHLSPNQLPVLQACTVLLPSPVCAAGRYDQVRINFANPDMVGHTGDLEATVRCCTLVDKCVKVRGMVGSCACLLLLHAERMPGARRGEQPVAAASVVASILRRCCGPVLILVFSALPPSIPAGAARGGGRDERPLPGHLRPRQRRRHGAGTAGLCGVAGLCAGVLVCWCASWEAGGAAWWAAGWPAEHPKQAGYAKPCLVPACACACARACSARRRR